MQQIAIVNKGFQIVFLSKQLQAFDSLSEFHERMNIRVKEIQGDIETQLPEKVDWKDRTGATAGMKQYFHQVRAGIFWDRYCTDGSYS